MDVVFDGMAEHDWEHALGGIHATVWEGDAAVAHGSVMMRRLLLEGRALRCGYVEAVATRPDRRGMGHATPGDGGPRRRDPRRLRHRRARGDRHGGSPLPPARLAPVGGAAVRPHPGRDVRTPEVEKAVHILPVGSTPDITAALTCDWRDGDVW